MNNPGVYQLLAEQITVALTAEAFDGIDDLDGMTAVSLEATLAYGSGGTACVAKVQTSADGGDNWRDVARFDFATASATKVANLSGMLSKAVTSYAVLSAEGVFDGFLGDRLRVVVTSTGTYVDTTLAINAVVR